MRRTGIPLLQQDPRIVSFSLLLSLTVTGHVIYIPDMCQSYTERLISRGVIIY